MLLNNLVASKFRWLGLCFACVLFLSGCDGTPDPTTDKTKPAETLSDARNDSAPDPSPPSPAESKPKPDEPAIAVNSDSNADKKNSESKSDPAQPPTAQPKPKVADVNDSRFHPQLLEAVDEYLQYAMVNTAPMVAPTDCRAPEQEPRPKVSEAEDETAHGKKLYFLFAKDLGNYSGIEKNDAPAGQVLVKESWSSKPSNENARNMRNHASAIRINPRVTVDGKTLAIGKRTDLFVMLKLDPTTQGTDEGWVYGVVDADSRNVKSAGKVASCMECHVGQRDRLFRVEQAVVIREEVVEPKNNDSQEEPNQDGGTEPKEESGSNKNVSSDLKEKSDDGDK